MTTITSMRQQNYKQAVALADKTLVPEIGRVQEFTDVAIRATNACTKYVNQCQFVKSAAKILQK